MKRGYRRGSRGIRRERLIMYAASGFVLAALTLTGLYMRSKNLQDANDGYIIDFSNLEASNKEEIMDEVTITDTKDKEEKNSGKTAAGENEEYLSANVPSDHVESVIEESEISKIPDGEEIIEDDLDYMPMEVGSDAVEIPEAEEIPAEIHFGGGLNRPVSGEVIIDYSMDRTVYFATLEQYQYNPAIIYRAGNGDKVFAAGAGKVLAVGTDARLGNTLSIDMGDGYVATYGQLAEIFVKPGDNVNSLDEIGTVALPTKYYSMEGCNLYFQVTCNGENVNPNDYF